MGQQRTHTPTRRCVHCGETVRWIDGTWQVRGDEVCINAPLVTHPMDRRHEVRDTNRP